MSENERLDDDDDEEEENVEEFTRKTNENSAYEVNVTDPETRQSGISRFTTYLISGHEESGRSFSSRKRYTDFQWVRTALVDNFPGFFVPPIPRKRKIGRFDEEFVERRREGLEAFLKEIFNRPYLANLSFFRSWLQRAESGMESLKREIAIRPLVDAYEEYKNIVSSWYKDKRHKRVTDMGTLRTIGQYLEKNRQALSRIKRSASQLSQSHAAVQRQIEDLQAHLSELNMSEQQFMGVNDIGTKPRVDLSEPLLCEKEVRSEYLRGNYSIFLSVIMRELQDTECMLDSVASLERLTAMWMQIRSRLGRQQNQQQCIKDSQHGNMIVNLFQRKDKDTQLYDLTADVEKSKEMMKCCEEWVSVAAGILVESELVQFTNEKIDNFKLMSNEFSKRQLSQNVQLTEVWRSYIRDASWHSNNLENS
eukprot:GHVL01023961.1.p1 GENE.GHVL01023961.1~~GHVL01023961.1.p1  ORF type:complete len:422 (+),score=77.33 GHVL01023961.1:82-1347(+)